MAGLNDRKYNPVTKRRATPISIAVSVIVFVAVVMLALGIESAKSLFDAKSLMIVVGGTIASLLFQFDIRSLGSSAAILVKSFGGTPSKEISLLAAELDEALVRGSGLSEMRKGERLTGELLEDVTYMYHKGLSFEEIDELITNRIKDDFFARETAMNILQKSAIIAPAFGLFGTVIGLVHVMQSMANPAMIGPSMSLALLTTAYGAGFASLVFTPMAGRLEHHNAIYIETYRQVLSKIGILMKRDEKSLEVVRNNDERSAA
jgi:chemotaxis protein MotA